MAERAKPHGNRHDKARIPKIILQDRDFSQIEIFMMKLRKGEVDTLNGEIIMTAMDGEQYRVLNALDGWMEYWRTMADRAGIEYDDKPLQLLKNKLRNGMPLTMAAIDAADQVIDQQRTMYQRIHKESISSVATTQQIKMMMEDVAF